MPSSSDASVNASAMTAWCTMSFIRTAEFQLGWYRQNLLGVKPHNRRGHSGPRKSPCGRWRVNRRPGPSGSCRQLKVKTCTSRGENLIPLKRVGSCAGIGSHPLAATQKPILNMGTSTAWSARRLAHDVMVDGSWEVHSKNEIAVVVGKLRCTSPLTYIG